MAQQNDKKPKISSWIKINKSFETFTTKYSHKYTPTVICDCGKPCKYRNEDRTFKFSDPALLSSSPNILQKYQTKKLIKDDKIDLRKDMFIKYRDPNNVILNESVIALNNNNNNNNKSGSDSVNLLDDSNGVYSNLNYTQDMISNLA